MHAHMLFTSVYSPTPGVRGRDHPAPGAQSSDQGSGLHGAEGIGQLELPSRAFPGTQSKFSFLGGGGQNEWVYFSVAAN